MVVPFLYEEPEGLTFESASEFVGGFVSTFATFDATEEPTLPTLSVSCSRYS